ncbi:ATP-dependent RNA helicase Rhau [Oratosquilla oratoria]|uniref:ATP-dependent RNA helicase Rhau n=1 Tax=Oratosquilla oratoria TaxID=337810 RepID=UPI003F7579B8
MMYGGGGQGWRDQWSQRESGYGGRGRGGYGGRGGGSYRGGGGGSRGGGRVRGGRGGPPPGLKGKEIGLWYAKRSRERQEKDEKQVPVLSMNKSQAHDISRVLDSLGAEKIEEPHDDLGVEWDERISSLIKREFQDEDVDNEEASCADSFSNPDAWIQENAVKQEHTGKLSKDNCFAQHLTAMKDSDFKTAYAANVRANKRRDTEGLRTLKHEELELQKRPEIDQQLLESFKETRNNPKYQAMLEFRKKLPSYKMQDEILSTIRDNQVVVLSGETGCGKTTQVAQFIMDDAIASGNGSTCRIVCTQPRRISAISVAQRVADERGERLGKSIGYQIRLESAVPRREGSIMYCTTGIILQWMQSDPLLLEISHLILDEIHERDMLSDFLICICKDLLQMRPDMKLVLMSATLNAEMFSEYYGNAPMIHIPGFTFPVVEYYLEDAIEATGFEFPSDTSIPKWRRKEMKKQDEYDDIILPYIRELENGRKYSYFTLDQLRRRSSEEMNLDFVLALLKHICTLPPGAILVFLPGWEQISNLHKMLQSDPSMNSRNHIFLPLHSLMPTVNQREVFDRPPAGVRKIVLATNIAETSITIDDIVYVVDCGRIKMKNFDKEANLSTLLPEWVTLANARQRRGRAGRVQDGVCFHLYSRAREMVLDEYPLPEIQRTRLEEIILHLKMLKLGSIKPLLCRIMQPPDENVVDMSLQMLQAINALDLEENLTPLGFHLGRLPVDPLTGRMLLMGAIFSCVGPILSVAASLSFKDPFIIPLGKERVVDEIKKKMSRGSRSDHLMLVNVFDGWETAVRYREDRGYVWDNFLSSSVLNQLQNMRKQFMGLLYEHKFVKSKDPRSHVANRNSSNLALVRAVITSGLYPNVARILPSKSRNPNKPLGIRTEYERKVALHPKSVNDKERNFESPWLVYREKIKSSKVYIHDCSMVPNYPLLFFGQKLNYDQREGIINVDRFVRIRCTRHVADLVQSLRNELDKLLEYKISHPGETRWDKNSKEGTLLHTIVDLITSEKMPTNNVSFDNSYGVYDDADDDYGDD